MWFDPVIIVAQAETSASRSAIQDIRKEFFTMLLLLSLYDNRADKS